jgi:hypothetical protein
VGLLALTGCANRLTVDVAKDHDLAAYRTWAWQPPDPTGAAGDPELGAQLKKLLAQGLVERGYSQVAADQSPDLFVAFHISVTVQQQLRSRAHARETLDTSWGRGGQSYVLDRPSWLELVPYERATLTVGVRDASDREIIWFAEKRREVQGEFAPHLEDTLAEVLSRFPPRVTGS